MKVLSEQSAAKYLLVTFVAVALCYAVHLTWAIAGGSPDVDRLLLVTRSVISIILTGMLMVIRTWRDARVRLRGTRFVGWLALVILGVWSWWFVVEPAHSYVAVGLLDCNAFLVVGGALAALHRRGDKTPG